MSAPRGVREKAGLHMAENPGAGALPQYASPKTTETSRKGWEARVEQ